MKSWTMRTYKKEKAFVIFGFFFSGNKFIWRCPIISWYCHLRWPRIYNHLVTLTNISYQKWHILVHTYEPSTFQEFSTRHCINVNIHYTDIYVNTAKSSIGGSAMNFLTSLTNKNRWCPPPPTPPNKNIPSFLKIR